MLLFFILIIRQKIGIQILIVILFNLFKFILASEEYNLQKLCLKANSEISEMMKSYTCSNTNLIIKKFSPYSQAPIASMNSLILDRKNEIMMNVEQLQQQLIKLQNQKNL